MAATRNQYFVLLTIEFSVACFLVLLPITVHCGSGPSGVRSITTAFQRKSAVPAWSLNTCKSYDGGTWRTLKPALSVFALSPSLAIST